MIQQHSYLIFRINNSLYGVDTHSVQEIFSLPEITPIPKARQGIVGVIDVRKQILPVVDLNILGRSAVNPYALTDRLIVLELAEQNLAIVVDEVLEIRNVAQKETKHQIDYEGQFYNFHAFIADIIRSETEVLLILDLISLFQYVLPNGRTSSQKAIIPLLTSGNLPLNLEQGDSSNQTKESEVALLFNGTADSQMQFDPETLAILRERANQLREIDIAIEKSANISHLAIVALNGELFGLNLEYVREFINIERTIPVPCCPPHIIGNMNLRGEILTLVDICHLLNLPPINLTKVSHLMVVEVDELRVGLTIEKVWDAIAIDTSQIDLIPAANHSTSKEYFKGTLTYQEKIVSILDIANILLKGNLIVDRA